MDCRLPISPLISRRARPKLLSGLLSKMFICAERFWTPVLKNACYAMGRDLATDVEAQVTCGLRNQDSGYVRNAMGRKSAPGAVALVPSRERNLGEGPPSIATIENFHLIVESVGFPYDAVRELALGI